MLSTFSAVANLSQNLKICWTFISIILKAESSCL